MNRKTIAAMGIAEAKAFLDNRPRNWRMVWRGRVLHFFEHLTVAGKSRGHTLCNQDHYEDDFFLPHLSTRKKCNLCKERYRLIENQARQPQ
jgi:hypothetical protein